MKKRIIQVFVWAFAGLCVWGLGFGASAEMVSKNPLLTPPVIDEYTQTEDEFLNILFLGIDFGGDTYKTSGGKRKLEDCHTDGVIVVSLNKTKGTIQLVSIPRDSLTYIPGIKGIYKFNGAINCGETIEEGCELACKAASWHLGGIEIERYVAVDATALVALGDAIGGVQNFTVDTGFQGENRWYENGKTYDLDGMDMMNYMRVRKGATVGHNDLGRTQRQRRMLAAIFAKVKSNPALLMDVLKVYQNGEMNIFTNVSVFDALKIAPMFLNISLSNVETHVLTGPYKAFAWNFTFNDQEHRQEVIKEVYGLDVPQMKYVSFAYTQWLTEAGMTTAKYLNIARDVIAHAQSAERMDDKQRTALEALISEYDALVALFDQAADTMESKDTSAMVKARTAIKENVDKAAELFDYQGTYAWGQSKYWYSDPWVNECRLNWN